MIKNFVEELKWRGMLAQMMPGTEEFLMKEFEYIADKLDFTKDELQRLFHGENKTFNDYKNKRSLIGLGSKMMRSFGLEKRLFR